jgi:ABC-type branched-subunit amino acid transport system substrate-binding protein
VAGGSGATAPGQSGTPTVGNSTGISATEIRIGFVIAAGNPGTAFGGSVAYDQDANARMVKAFVEETNARGGIAGRQIVPYYAFNDNSDQSDRAQLESQTAACTSLTEDHHVFAVIAINPGGVKMSYDCYAKHHTPLIDSVLDDADQERMDQLAPWLLLPMYMNFTRMARLLPQVLKQESFLSARMGIISYDRPSTRRVTEKVLAPELERLGGKVLEKVYLEPSYQGIGSGTASAVLRFKGLNIDRVVVLAPGGGALAIFASQADSQGYHPRYGISTYDAPANLEKLMAQTGVERQLDGAVGVGFLPGRDILDAYAPALTPRERACFDVVRKRTGSNYSARQQDAAAGTALGACEHLAFLKAALEQRVGRSLTQPEVGVEVAKLGGRYLPVNVPSSSFGPKKLDGVNSYSVVAYTAACKCFQYRGPWRGLT